MKIRGLPDTAADPAQEHIRQGGVRQGGHLHMVQGGGPGDHVHRAHLPQGQGRAQGREPGEAGGEQQHQEGPGTQGRVKGVLPQAAAQPLHHNGREQPAGGRRPVGHGGGQRQGQQQPGDQGGAVGQGVILPQDQPQQPLPRQGGQHTHRRHQRGPEALDDHARDQGGQQGDHHVQHQPGGGVLPPDVGGRAHRQIHFAPSFIARLPARKPCTRGTLPGQA